uniref:Uncharacterized protein n=1 Tax=Moniliophthora roreri TaxID=221103 RepID=A0A0W0FU73_MONRR
MATIEDVRGALSALKLKTDPLKDAELCNAADKLSSYLTLLELSSISLHTARDSRVVFRKELILLYKRFPTEAFRFSTVLYSFIHSRQILEGGGGESTNNWSGIMHGILSGVMDYLDEPGSTASAKAIVAKNFYSLLSAYYFPSEIPESTVDESDKDLLCAVYMLLGDLVRGHKGNQHDLRNKYAGGGKHIGAALARRREFETIEALLQLIANLLPSAQGDNQKRNQFLDAVFDPNLFPYHEAMKGLMAKLPKADWEEIERRLIDILAKTNINFPQPFKIVQSSVNCNVANPVGRLYMEEKAITSNGGAYNTFCVPYTSIERIRFSSYDHSPACTTFTFDLSSPPRIGYSPERQRQPATLTVDIERSSQSLFLEIFKARGLLRVVDHGEPKLSKLDAELSLEFPSTFRTIEEKVQQFCEFPSEGDGLLVTARVPTPLTPLPEQSSPIPATSAVNTLPKPQNRGDDNQETEKLSEKGVLPNMTGVGVLQLAKPKRKSQADDGSMRPKKRSRDDPSSEADPTSDLFGKSPKTAPKKRYGRKARTSSPAPPDSESEYEEVPAPRSRKVPAPAKHAKRGKALAMKAKTNKKQVTTTGQKELPKEEKVSNRDTKRPIEMSSDIDEYDFDDAKIDDKSSNTFLHSFGASRKADDYKDKKPHVDFRTVEDELKPQRTPTTKIAVVKAPGKTKRQVQIVESKDEDDTIIAETPAPKTKEKEHSKDPENKDQIGKGLKAPTEDHHKQSVIKNPLSEVKVKKIVEFNKTPGLMQNTATAGPGQVLATDIEKRFTRRSARAAGQRNVEFNYLSLFGGLKLNRLQKQDQQQALNASEKTKSRDNSYTVKGILGPALTISPAELYATAYEEYLVPIKRSGEAEQSPAAEKTTIDLTQDDFPKPLPLASKPVPAASVLDTPIPLFMKSPPKKAKTHPLITHPPELNSPEAQPDIPLHFSPMNKDSHQSSKFIEHQQPEALLRLDIKPHDTPVLLINHTSESSAITVPKETAKSHSAHATGRFFLGAAAQSTLRILNQNPSTLDADSTTPEQKTSRNPNRSSDNQFLTKSTERPPRSQHVSALAQASNLKTQVTHLDKKGHRPAFGTFKPAATSTRSPVVPRRLGISQLLPLSTNFTDPAEARVGGTKHEQPDIFDDDAEEDPDTPRDIVEVLNLLLQVLVDKITKRIESVGTEVRIGRDNILREAAVEVENMASESVACFNALVELESEYSSYRREVMERLEDAHRINTSIVERLGEIVEHHDRNSASKRFPKSLPALPSSLGISDA